MSAIVGTDLDRTIIYSAGAAAPHGQNAFDPGPVVCVEHYDGVPLSFMTARALDWLDRAMASERVVPVTTRTVEQYMRVQLPRVPEYAVCLNGARVLLRGVELVDWSAQVATKAAASSSPVPVVEAAIVDVSRQGQALAPWIKSVRNASGAFCYIVCHRAEHPVEWLEALHEIAEQHQWTMSMQGRKVYMVPAPLTKEAALAHVADRVGATTWAAAGDSLLDAGMIAGSVNGRVPRGSELASGCALGRHVRLTDALGIRAGEEIAEWIWQLVTT